TSFEPPGAHEGLREARHAGGNRHPAVRLAHHLAGRHALDRGLVEADHAVVHARQAAAHEPAEADLDRAGDHAERLAAFPARLGRLPAVRGASHHPAAEALAAEAPAGKRAAHWRADEQRRSDADVRVAVEGFEHNHAAQAVADEVRRAI